MKCPTCPETMERFTGVPVSLIPGRPARRNVGWICPNCHHDISEGWEEVTEGFKKPTRKVPEVVYPEDDRPIRFADTRDNRRLGLAMRRGYAQGTAPEYGLFFFFPAGSGPGDKGIGVWCGMLWYYTEESYVREDWCANCNMRVQGTEEIDEHRAKGHSIR